MFSNIHSFVFVVLSLPIMLMNKKWWHKYWVMSTLFCLIFCFSFLWNHFDTKHQFRAHPADSTVCVYFDLMWQISSKEYQNGHRIHSAPFNFSHFTALTLALTWPSSPRITHQNSWSNKFTCEWERKFQISIKAWRICSHFFQSVCVYREDFFWKLFK